VRRHLHRLPRHPLRGLPLHDPKGQDLDTVRRIVGELDDRRPDPLRRMRVLVDGAGPLKV
jgi:hypothetical protein